MIRIVANHWGWHLRGIWWWLKYGWAWPITFWGVEITGSQPRRFTRRVKVGPVCFPWGTYGEDGWP